MKKRTRWIMIAGGLTAALIGVGIARSGSAKQVEIAPVRRGALQVVVEEKGQTRVRDRVVVAAPVSGLLMRIELDEGAVVAPGAVIARIYPAPESARDSRVARAQAVAADARRREAVARVAELKARVDQVERDLGRSRPLGARGAITAAALEQREMAAATARQQLEAARATVSAAAADVVAARAAIVGTRPQASDRKPMEIHAPIAGRVLRVIEKNERVVAAGTALVALGDAGRLEAVVEVLSEDAVRIPPAAPVLVSGWGGDATLRGKVRLIEPEAFTEVSALGVEEQRVRVVADLDEVPAGLGAGYRIEASIVTWSGAKLLTVPTSALFRRNQAWQVFVVNQGKAALRAIHVGHRSAEQAEVLDGLAEGDKVILFPDDQIREGTAVEAAGA